MTNLGSILKSKDITLPTKVHIVKAMVFSVVMYRYEILHGVQYNYKIEFTLVYTGDLKIGNFYL